MESGQLIGQLGEDTAAVWKVGFLKGGGIALVALREGMVMIEIWHVE